jgi:hypothetical protein
MRVGEAYLEEWDHGQAGAGVKVVLCSWDMSSSCGYWRSGTIRKMLGFDGE